MDNITPVNGIFEFVADSSSIYSLSTTTGQQKGSFDNIPASKPFPLPYYETFEEYKNPKGWGYLPSYTADIVGVFEIADRSDKKGKCIRQVIGDKPLSWAPEWMPYSVIGNSDWTDYEVQVDAYIENEGQVGLMGRVAGTGTGFGTKPDGYYMTLSANGECNLYVSTMKERVSAGTLLASGKATDISANKWHTLKLSFAGSTITGFVDNVQVLKATDYTFLKGTSGLLTGIVSDKKYTTAQFDNLIIKTINCENPKERALSKKVFEIY